MTSPIGYNNPAYSHQFDSSLYDYQYVPEIDPGYEGHPERQQEQIHLVHPDFHDEFSGASEEFDASDESNQSIIVEECNNRRVTLICEKRNKTESKYYEDANYRGAYHHNISLESEDDYRMSREEGKGEEVVSQRHQRKLEPPLESNGNFINGGYDMRRNQGVARTSSSHFQVNQRPQRQHRYEEIGAEEDRDDEINRNRVQQVSRHRYAEITVDENGYPSIGNEIEIERNESGYRIVNTDTPREFISKAIPKPRAASPISQSISPTFSPSKTYQRTISPRPPNCEVISASRMAPTRAAPIPNRSAPHSAIEMAELSPPHGTTRTKTNQTPFFQSPKRQPPIGASSPADLHEHMKLAKSGKAGRANHKRQGSISVTPNKSGIKTSVTQMFQVKTTPKTQKTLMAQGRGEERNSSRRNISHSFTDPPKEFASESDFTSRLSSPYRPTTTEVIKAKTAIITPILQRKNKRNEMGYNEDLDNFKKMSHTFQSTGNLYKSGLPTDGGVYCADKSPDLMDTKARIKRNRSVPNFAQSLANEGKFKYVRGDDYQSQGFHKSARKLDYQYSPAKSMDKFSPISRSRMSLIDQTKMSWSNSGSDLQSANSGCLILGAVIQIITSLASCAICFYLFSKLGRRYYLDFGILAGFVNFVLGVLGFRSQCWRWLPNRNYVSGYILLTAFSILTCAGFVYLITARPMSGDPILDVMGGGICGVSVLTIILSMTGLTMSGCCKSPPPDNRVNNI